MDQKIIAALRKGEREAWEAYGWARRYHFSSTGIFYQRAVWTTASRALISVSLLMVQQTA